MFRSLQLLKKQLREKLKRYLTYQCYQDKRCYKSKRHFCQKTNISLHLSSNYTYRRLQHLNTRLMKQSRLKLEPNDHVQRRVIKMTQNQLKRRSKVIPKTLRVTRLYMKHLRSSNKNQSLFKWQRKRHKPYQRYRLKLPKLTSQSQPSPRSSARKKSTNKLQSSKKSQHR